MQLRGGGVSDMGFEVGGAHIENLSGKDDNLKVH